MKSVSQDLNDVLLEISTGTAAEQFLQEDLDRRMIGRQTVHRLEAGELRADLLEDSAKSETAIRKSREIQSLRDAAGELCRSSCLKKQGLEERTDGNPYTERNNAWRDSKSQAFLQSRDHLSRDYECSGQRTVTDLKNQTEKTGAGQRESSDSVICGRSTRSLPIMQLWEQNMQEND